MKEMCPAKMEVASLQITCEHFFIHPIIPKMFVYVFLFADYQIRQSQKSSCSCIFNWGGWRHSFWKAANLTTFMTPGTWNMQPVGPVACWCLSNQQTSGTNDAPPPRLHGYHGGGQWCALAFGTCGRKWFQTGIFWYTCISKTSKKIHDVISHIAYHLAKLIPFVPSGPDHFAELKGLAKRRNR